MELIYQLSLLLLLVSGACKPSTTPVSNKATSMANSSDYRQLAESRLGAKVQYTFNEAHTMVLCLTNESVAAPAITNSLRFLVILLKENTIVYEDQIANAQVEWYNNTQIKIHTFPGTVQIKPSQQTNYYLYDLETKQKLAPGANKL